MKPRSLYPIALVVGLGCSSATELSEADRLTRNKRLVSRFIAEVVNTGELGKLDEIVSPAYFETAGPEDQPTGVDAAKQHVIGVRKTYPDLKLTVEQQLAEGDWVATRIRMRGTHLGAWFGMRPTGKTIEITGVNLDRIQGGRIVEHGGAANMLFPLLGIGAVRVVGEGDPPSPSASTSAVRAAIAVAWREHIAAAKRKDVRAVTQIYTDDVIYRVGGEEVRGRAAIDRMEARTLATADVLDAVHTTASLRVFGDVAYELGTVVGPVQAKGQAARDVTFHYMATWRRGDDGSWRIRCLVGE